MKPTFLHASLLAVMIFSMSQTMQVEGTELADEIKVFDGQPRLLIVHGYSTSQHWWAFLQRKIDRFSGGADKRVVEVQLCNKGGTPIARWMDLEGGARTEAWQQMLTPMIQAEKGERPVMVLAQQSLQWVFPGDRTEGVRSAEDQDRIQDGAAAIEQYAQLILEDGAAAVVIGMHIFKHSLEPEIGNERFALAELSKRKPDRIFAGPDTWEPTKQHFPLAFDADRIHPNFIGAEIMAHYWFDALLKREGLETPGWSRQEMEDAIKHQPMGVGRDKTLFEQKLKEWKIVNHMPASAGRDRTGASIPSAVLRRYDKDRDGKLNQEERKAFEKARADRRKK